ncbi:hypothetical protein RRG08_019619 [Elysia crispata]|uniref:Uncharacterized protein n=1 Tax=Elysia crispata TaxID=231223 RepID=A0AAE1E6G7_9GAST|nr:hypothetical protein RRG08_019619 [Elysia crispata]
MMIDTDMTFRQAVLSDSSNHRLPPVHHDVDPDMTCRQAVLSDSSFSNHGSPPVHHDVDPDMTCRQAVLNVFTSSTKQANTLPQTSNHKLQIIVLRAMNGSIDECERKKEKNGFSAEE